MSNATLIRPALLLRALRQDERQELLNTHAVLRDKLNGTALSSPAFFDAVIETDIPLPKWLCDLADWYEEEPQSAPRFSARFITDVPLAAFFDVAEPIISRTTVSFRQWLETYSAEVPQFPFNIDELEQQLLFDMAFSIFDMLDRTMVLELNVARLSSELTGDTSEDRFNSFIHLLSDPVKRIALLEEYPVLFRSIYEFSGRWLDNSMLFVQRLTGDWQKLKEHFNITSDGGIRKLHINAGDRHNNGKTVILITFNTGEKIVYKPRGLDLDLYFQQILQWFNDKGVQPAHKLLNILNRQDYGWMEFVTYQQCSSPGEIERFYSRIGSLLAILYAINATDFHYENIIAAGEYPVLIDLESLFHNNGAAEIKDIDSFLVARMKQSVLQIHILPFKLYMDEGVVDISGVSDVEGTDHPKMIPIWEGKATDEMKLTRMRGKFTESKNSPRLQEKKVNVLDYAQYIDAAFKSCYDLIMHNKEAMLNHPSLLGGLSRQVQVRILVRATAAYTQLIRAGFHPDYLRDALKRDQLFEMLWTSEPSGGVYLNIVPSEIASLNRMDVPFFVTTPDSLDIYPGSLSEGKPFFSQTGYEQVRQKIADFSEADRELQCWYIKAALSSSTSAHGGGGVDKYISDRYLLTGERSVTQEELVDAAKSIASRIATLAIRYNDHAQWVSLIQLDDDNCDVKPLMIDIYSGISGVVLFLGALTHTTEDKSCNDLFNQSLNKLLQMTRIFMDRKYTHKMGAFDGWGGVLYTLQLLEGWSDREDIRSMKEEIRDYIIANHHHITEHDILGGTAGLILCLMKVYDDTGDEELLQTMTSLSGKLLEAAVKMEEGIGWQNTITGNILGGLGHGGGGIAIALMEMYALTGKEEYQLGAEQALAYERSLFIPQSGNWMDKRAFRSQELEDQIAHEMIAWCHGATGIGLSRLKIYRHMPAEVIKNETMTAISTVLERGMGKNQSVCHGDFGNMELLMMAAHEMNISTLQEQVNRIAASLVEYIRENGSICGVALGVENPGFMLGLSGIGYQLLRLAYPDVYPSVALLD
ncbi:type 2 lanthipeptide synthetase LanM family protein [Chitinophaga tropicalis]|uniref:Type 2 lantipeptide synthetase LanM n=1 Tax=Chitinophaga tropicalis TaxID=2683588 RepID=A0A7K1UAN7_9BACT|nr:type 2 lanthipeptide synthetase LanM family protein [Chitinophaga tropicalis]MVT11437.1 type 2 lantipeptide synthetase LanM [Chitinophaga tropicalis]